MKNYKFNPNKGTAPNRIDIPGASVKYYCCFKNDDGTMECEHSA